MIDLKRLTSEPEYRVGIERKRVQAGLIDEVIELELKRRELDSRVQVLRAERNAASKAIGAAAAEERDAKIAAAGTLKQTLDTEETALSELAELVNTRALSIPNPADASVPDGGEEDSVVVREVGASHPRDRLALEVHQRTSGERTDGLVLLPACWRHSPAS